MKPQRFWAVVDRHGRVEHQYDEAEGYLRISVDRFVLSPGDGQRVVRVEVRVVEPKPRKARKVR